MKRSGFIKLIFSISILNLIGNIDISAQTKWAEYEKLDTARYGLAYIVKENDKLLNDDIEKKFVLLIGDRYLRFCDLNTYRVDSLFSKKRNLATIDEQVLRAAIDNYLNASKDQIYVNLEDSTYEYLTRSGDNIGYKEKIPQVEWELIDGDTTIAKLHPKMTLKKAKANFGGRIWYALYNPELPFPYGPYFFGGLPGLIISLWDNDRDFIINLAPGFNMKVDNILKTIKIRAMLKRENFYKTLWHNYKEGGLCEGLQISGMLPDKAKPKPRQLHYVPLMK